MLEYKSEKFIKDDLSLGIFLDRHGSVIGVHMHDFVEIVYVLDGEAVEKINDVSYRLRRGDMLFINYGSTHAYVPRDKFTYYNVCFLPEVVYERIINRDNAFDLLSLTAIDEILRAESSVGKITFTGEERRVFETLLADMEAECRSDRAERRAVLESYMTILVAKIMRRAIPGTITQSAENAGVWREVTEFINSNLGERLTLEALAKKCFYNPSYFSRCFKERLGMTLVEYISRARAERAAALLCDGTLTVNEIAELCGFTDRSSLYRAFSKRYGMTPKEYRDKNT